ncbi:MAG: alpha/beta hydrolase [Sulfolobales archaeon]
MSFRLLSRKSSKAVVLVHGNLSSSAIWEDIMSSVQEDFDVVAPDLRGFGDSGRAPVDATRGLRDFSDDLLELLSRLGYKGYVMVGHSMGGGVVLQALLDAPSSVRIEKVVLVDPVSPYGYGGTKDEFGTPCYSDYAGSGAGLVLRYNPDFVNLLKAKYTGVDHPSAPVNAVKSLFADDFVINEKLQKKLLDMLFSVEVGVDNYPGDYVESPNWPYVAPGTRGVLNAMSPKYMNLYPVVKASLKPPVLWIHGSKDVIVSDMSLLDLAVLGAMGFIPGYPGQEVFPPQPMVRQIEVFLREYESRGGTIKKVLIDGAGHTPFIEKPDRFIKELQSFIY